jgi:hypothetical protein
MHSSKSAVAFVVSLISLASYAQTDNCPFPALQFSWPPLRLREEICPKPVESQPTSAVASDASASAEAKPVVDVEIESDLHSQFVRSDRFYLIQTKPRSDEGGLLDEIFTPEVVQVGKTTVSSPFITAIKKQNPLCLLTAVAAEEEATGDLGLTFTVLHVEW